MQPTCFIGLKGSCYTDAASAPVDICSLHRHLHIKQIKLMMLFRLCYIVMKGI